MSPVLAEIGPGKIVLYSYWRSSCSWRVRIALHYKQFPFEYRPINLLKQEQSSAEYVDQLNPSALVPSLIIDNKIFTQSIAILEYLEERRPESWRLMPVEAAQRAQVRTIVQMIACDIQPVQNLRVLQKAVADSQGHIQKTEWAQYWISAGLDAVEKVLKLSAGIYCVGDHVTLADVCLVPQVYNARRFGIDVECRYPVIHRIDKSLSELDAFIKAHPDQQPDSVKQ